MLVHIIACMSRACWTMLSNMTIAIATSVLAEFIVRGPVPATSLEKGGRRPVSPPRMYPPFFLLDTLEKGAMIREQAQAPLRT